MKLPNDLIKATDYSKAKDREIHEFEYRNGKYIHKYVLGGEHELTPQEIIDCLNGLATIDCDLQTAYAYIKGHQEQLVLTEKALELACENLPMKYEYCSSHPEKYNLQDEYGSDEPYWVEEGGCEFDSPERCLECVIKYFKNKAKEICNGR